MIMVLLNARTVSFYYVWFVFNLLCCKYICGIYLSMMQSNGLCKLNNIYLEDYRRHSVTVTQRRNDHMQVHIIIMEGK